MAVGWCPALLGRVESTVDDQLAAHQCPRRGSCAQTLRTHSTRPQSQRTTRASALHTGPRFWTPVAPPVTAPGQLVQPVRRPLFLRDCKEPTYPPELGPLSLPGPALQALLALCISCLSRSSVCVCLPIRPWPVSTYRLSARYTERQRERVCVCLCVGFLTFSSRSSISPTSPVTSPSLPTTTLLSHPFLFRPCLVASPVAAYCCCCSSSSSRDSRCSSRQSRHIIHFLPPVQLNSLLL